MVQWHLVLAGLQRLPRHAGDPGRSRDGKGFVFLTYDTTPNYTDTHPLPATPTKWKYRAIYRVGDAQVGLWSAEVGIAVGG